mmetsp:Transcript_79997/g.97917  ORF Transcript_79997/g.97917 Transcript_79997/m.97917 type:complete len:209 (-) Transcript_79997:67-693(-)
MCKCLNSVPKFVLYILNILHVICGIILLGFMTYVMINYRSLLPEIGIGLGGFVTIVGLLGIFSVKIKGYYTLTTYAILMSLLLLANTTILIISFSNFDSLLKNLNSKGDSDIDNAKQWMRDRKVYVIWILISIVAVEFVCVWFGLIYRQDNEREIYANRQDTKLLSDDNNSVSDYNLSVNGNGFDGLNDEPKSAASKNRQSMRDKYGL